MSARMRRRVLELSLACTAVFSIRAGAQIAPPRALGPNTLSGVVVDSLGIAVPEATVYISELRRLTRTRDDGTFRFDSVRAGEYTVGARAIGYVSATSTVTVGRDGGSVTLEMVRIALMLPSRVTTANRGGLSGVIGDTSYRAMAGVTVKAMGSGAGSAVTDSTGEFFLPVKPGRYLVRLEKEGFGRQLVGVTVPADTGRRIAAWLTPMPEDANALEGANLFDLEQRLIRSRPVSNRYYTREDFTRLNIQDAQQAVERASARRVTDFACALINGGPQWAPLWTIAAADIEFMETNTGVSRSPRSTSINRNMAIGSGRSTGAVSCGHVVWLRK